ncbi:histidine phosphatase family protein [Nocardioides pyridinolyticus]
MSAEPRRLVLLRHGQTAWNAEQRIQGQLDADLDDTGHRQAAAVAPAVAALRPAALWSSDSARARQTAAYLAKETGLEPTYDARLREYFLADWQGLTHGDLDDRPGFEEFRRGNFDVVPGGEDAAEVAARMVAAVSELLETIGPGELAVAVSHGAAIRDAVPVLLGWPVTERAALHGPDNCAWVELDGLGDGPMRLRAYNRVAPD